MQAKAGHKEKRLGWGARLEAAAQAGAGVEVSPKSLLSFTGRSSPQHSCREHIQTKHIQTMDLTAAAFAHVADLSAPLDGSMADIHSVCACCIYLWNNSWSPQQLQSRSCLMRRNLSTRRSTKATRRKGITLLQTLRKALRMSRDAG